MRRLRHRVRLLGLGLGLGCVRRSRLFGRGLGRCALDGTELGGARQGNPSGELGGARQGDPSRKSCRRRDGKRRLMHGIQATQDFIGHLRRVRGAQALFRAHLHKAPVELLLLVRSHLGIPIEQGLGLHLASQVLDELLLGVGYLFVRVDRRRGLVRGSVRGSVGPAAAAPCVLGLFHAIDVHALGGQGTKPGKVNLPFARGQAREAHQATRGHGQRWEKRQRSPLSAWSTTPVRSVKVRRGQTT